MKILTSIFNFLRSALKTVRLSLPKIGVGWMFALLTINLNRIAIVELEITAVVITTMLALHYFLSPFQVITGRLADRHPIAGYRRSPYLMAGATIASLVFIFLPTIVMRMGEGVVWAYLVGFIAFIVYGVAIAIMGDSHHSMIAEVTDSKSRGAVISVVWTFSILSTIVAAGVMASMMPQYEPALMQQLYNLTPFVVIGCTLLGVVGMEKRLTAAEHEAAVAAARSLALPDNPIKAARRVLKDNQQARGFFAFVFIAIFSIFLQDNILEVFGAEVFGMTPGETSSFQQMWGGGVLLGMLVMGIASAVFAISKRTIVLVGCIGTAAGMMILGTAALTTQQNLVTPALVFMGLFTGFFNVGSLSMMMDMTVEGATGLYMGLWGVAQAFGNGTASFGSGVLHSTLIETGLMSPAVAYFGIFSVEAIGMVAAAAIIWRLSVQHFHREHQMIIGRGDAVLAMETGSIG